MKKNLLIGLLTCASFGGGVIYGQIKGHPNMQKAMASLQSADGFLTAAQKANEYDLGGHAAKAKNLIAQAMTEVTLAAK